MRWQKGDEAEKRTKAGQRRKGRGGEARRRRREWGRCATCGGKDE
jgi:hypothetical protein